MKEKQICTEIKKSLEAKGCYAFKIPDMPAGRWDAQGDGVPSRIRFNPPKAFDLFAVWAGLAIAIEAKLMRAPTALPINSLRESEAKHLAAFNAAGGVALVAVAYAFTPTEKQAVTLGSKRVRELWLVNWRDWQTLVAEASEAGRKSIKRDDLIGIAIGLPWLGKGLWDVEPLLSRMGEP